MTITVADPYKISVVAEEANNVTQLAFKPRDYHHLYLSLPGEIRRYDYEPETGQLSNPITIAKNDGNKIFNGLAWHENGQYTDLYVPYWRNTGNYTLSPNNGLIRMGDLNSDGDFLDANEQVLFINNIPIIPNVHQLNQLQIKGNNLFVGIGTKNNEDFNNRFPDDFRFDETAYNGAIAYIADLTQANFENEETIILQDDFSNLDNWTDLTSLISWGNYPVGTSGFSTGVDKGT